MLDPNIKPEDVEEIVKATVMKAALGETISAAVKKALTGYSNPIDEAVGAYVKDVAQELIRDVFSSRIRDLVREVIEKSVTDEMLAKTVDAIVKKMRDAMESAY